jgi:hypothetical protein
LIAKSILVSAVRTLPGDGIAGHAPYVFIHTSLANIEAASTAPTEAKFFAAAVALKAALSAASAPVVGGWCGFFHGCCLTIYFMLKDNSDFANVDNGFWQDCQDVCWPFSCHRPGGKKTAELNRLRRKQLFYPFYLYLQYLDVFPPLGGFGRYTFVLKMNRTKKSS